MIHMPSAHPREVNALIQRFRRQRPMRAGSLIVTILGDAIAQRGGTVTLGSIIRLTAPFRLPERLVRTSVARLAQDGWLTSRQLGRQSEYRLTEHGRRRFAEATERIYGESRGTWDGQWTLVFLPAVSRTRREQIRSEMRWLGFGQLQPGLLAHPMRTLSETRQMLRELGLESGIILMRASSEGAEADRNLVASGWDFGELSQQYRQLIASFEPVVSMLSQGKKLSPDSAFVVRTLLIHEYRKIHLRDPMLPDSLLPSDWVGSAAYEVCRDLYLRIFDAAEQYVSSTAETLEGPLPPTSDEMLSRFGGLRRRLRSA